MIHVQMPPHCVTFFPNQFSVLICFGISEKIQHSAITWEGQVDPLRADFRLYNLKKYQGSSWFG